MSEQNDSTPQFKITDKRRFASETPRPEQKKEPASKPAPAQTTTQEGEEQWDPTAFTFSTFVVSLATQAMMQLGVAPAPEGIPIAKDLAAARQTIDILGMLESKTKGNLTAREKELIERTLHELRLSFVKVAEHEKEKASLHQ